MDQRSTPSCCATKVIGPTLLPCVQFKSFTKMRFAFGLGEEGLNNHACYYNSPGYITV